jgi:hypothetical protein
VRYAKVQLSHIAHFSTLRLRLRLSALQLLVLAESVP